MLCLLLVLAQLTWPQCAAELTFGGIGSSAAHRVTPYADCLNSKIGTEHQLRTACASTRTQVVSGKLTNKADRAVAWLDAMIRERAACETHLRVVP